MIQTKLFMKMIADRNFSIDAQINMWLKEHPDINFIDLKTSNITTKDGLIISMTAFLVYEEKENSNE